MSWIHKLHETYENCTAMIGKTVSEKEVPLLPICHTTQKAQIEIVIDQDGNFIKARVVPKDDARTIIPCTESSGGRTSGPVAHPLCDKLQYIAKDYNKYGGPKTTYFNLYAKQLEEWCESEYSNNKVKAVLKYIEKGNVVKDLVDNKILYIGSDMKLLEKWDKKDAEQTPEIFKVSVASPPSDAFVRWVVEIPGDPQSSVWSDTDLFDCWTKYYSSIKSNYSLCYASGIESNAADQHPAKLRNDADRAKLISSNDQSGFTFRGRFTSDNQVCNVSFEVTQKAHSALRWLISRQGYRRGDQAIVAWATKGQDIPPLLADPLSIIGLDSLQSDSSPSPYTAQDVALKLNKKIAGYKSELGSTAGVVVMALESATPGRLSITYYKELTGSDFLERINTWHDTCTWTHTYRYIEVNDNKTGKKKKTCIPFPGAPSLDDITEAAYGSKVDDKLRKSTVERLLPCIIDGQRLPKDIVASVVQKACQRAGMEDWEWNKTLSIGCALYKKYYEKEAYGMSLEKGRKSRDYLYGRLLAVADSLEEWALKDAGENRQTNAARMMQRFADHPYSTWRNLELSLGPYKSRLGGRASSHITTMEEIMALFNPEEFITDKKLSGEFLLGYHCQREAMRPKKEA